MSNSPGKNTKEIKSTVDRFVKISTVAYQLERLKEPDSSGNEARYELHKKHQNGYLYLSLVLKDPIQNMTRLLLQTSDDFTEAEENEMAEQFIERLKAHEINVRKSGNWS